MGWKEENWIPPKVEDQLRDQNAFKFWKIKNTTRTGLWVSSFQQNDDDDEDEDSSDEDESYDCSNENAHPIAFMDAFQMEMRDAFE